MTTILGLALAAAVSAPASSPEPASPAAPAPRAASAAPSSASEEAALADAIRSDLSTLAADEMEGRGLGTPGLGKAADFIEKQLTAYGLDPAFAGSYRQRFPIKTGVTLKPGNHLDGVADGDWTPLGFSSPGSFAGAIAFLGYGIEAPELGYRELEGIDLKGKVALMLRYEPQEKDDASPFAGRKPSRWSALRYKVLQARERGAVAVVFVTGPLQDDGQDKLPALANDGPESPAGIPVVQVKAKAAAAWLGPAGIDLAAFQKAVDRDLLPRSRVLPARLAGTVALEASYAQADNLVGLIPGQGALAAETVVLGAHYDHLGHGGAGSMRPNDHAIHNGADDNASGTSVVLAAGRDLARRLAAVPSHRAVLVALFAGEEVGLAGSSFFVSQPPRPIADTAAMVNLDMVGRLRDNRLVALGSESAREWDPAIARAAALAGLEVTSRGDGYGPSDQTSFYAAHVPVIHLFTGAHEQYHTPEDDTDTINFPGAAKVARLTEALVLDLATAAARPVYARASSAPAMSGDSRGYGAYLGTVPDYRAMESTAGGVLLADARPGGPAALAGIKGGDRIVAMAGTRIENLYDMTYALQDHKPGETIDVVVVRGEERVTLKATLGDRARMAPVDAGHAAAASPSPAATPAPVAAAAPAAAAPAAAAPAAAAPAAAAPADPHAAAAGAAATASDKPALDPFYAGRPGPDFEVGAGKPFAPRFEGEKHLADIRQLTFGGENAEAYWSPDGTRLIFQRTPPGGGCDQEYVLDLKTGESTLVSTGKGRTTCGYFDWPEADRIVYASTHGESEACPPPPDRSQGYVWALYPSYDIYEALPDGSAVKNLTASPGYDAEATWCHRGGKLVFTTTRDGDPELYTMDEAGGNLQRLTREVGYDGGAFFSPDCSEIVWRASRPQGAELEEYKALMARNLIRPHALELYLARADGSDVRQLTRNGAANFCPYFTPDASHVIYSSNAGSTDGREFELWLVARTPGSESERITYAPGFDGFPVFSPDGRFLVWGSNRADPQSHETNLFLARWVE